MTYFITIYRILGPKILKYSPQGVFFSGRRPVGGIFFRRKNSPQAVRPVGLLRPACLARMGRAARRAPAAHPGRYLPALRPEGPVGRLKQRRRKKEKVEQKERKKKKGILPALRGSAVGSLGLRPRSPDKSLDHHHPQCTKLDLKKVEHTTPHTGGVLLRTLRGAVGTEHYKEPQAPFSTPFLRWVFWCTAGGGVRAELSGEKPQVSSRTQHSLGGVADLSERGPQGRASVPRARESRAVLRTTQEFPRPFSFGKIPPTALRAAQPAFFRRKNTPYGFIFDEKIPPMGRFWEKLSPKSHPSGQISRFFLDFYRP